MNALVALGVLERSGEARPVYTSQLNRDSRAPVRLGDCPRITGYSDVTRLGKGCRQTIQCRRIRCNVAALKRVDQEHLVQTVDAIVPSFAMRMMLSAAR